jgi:hypothetical protein
MLHYAKRYGCPSKHNRSDYPAMYACMGSVFREPVLSLRIDPSLNDSVLIQERMEEAGQPNAGKGTRYTFIPTAVGSAPGMLELPWSAGLMLGNSLSRPTGVPEVSSVRIEDWVTWLKRFFRREDMVIVKMDVEGAEHAIFAKLFATAEPLGLIDVLGLECHERGRRSCQNLVTRLRNHSLHSGTKLVSEPQYSGCYGLGPLCRGWLGVDRYSHPQTLLPVDPPGAEVHDLGPPIPLRTQHG